MPGVAVEEPAVALDDLHAEGVVCLHGDALALCRAEDVLASDENLAHSCAREAKEEDLLARLQRRNQSLGS
jgi:hypothetical protein